MGALEILFIIIIIIIIKISLVCQSREGAPFFGCRTVCNVSITETNLKGSRNSVKHLTLKYFKNGFLSLSVNW